MMTGSMRTRWLIYLMILFLSAGNFLPLGAQETEIYDYSAVSDGDFYNPTEYMGEDPGAGDGGLPSVEMEVSDEYRPDGYYEPYDFNFVPQNGETVSVGEPDSGYPLDTPLPVDDYNNQPAYDPAAYGQDTYVPEITAPVYDPALQVEMEEAAIQSPVAAEPVPDSPGVTSIPINEKAPIRFLVGIQQNPKRFLVASPALARALGQAMVSSEEREWLQLNNEVVKVFSDLSSPEPSYPELYEEFERVNSVLISFIFSGAFGAREGAILKWNDRLFAIVGPLSTRIKVRPVKMTELVERIAAALGGRLRRSLEDGTRYVDLSSLTGAVDKIMTEVSEGNFAQVKALSDGINTAGDRLKKLLNPFLHLLQAKFQLEAGKGEEKYRQALETLKL